MIEDTDIEFAPFVKFVIEFHNNSMTYSKLLRTKVQKVELLNAKDMELIEEAFLVKHVAEWEIFIHNIFAYCVAIDTSALSEHLDLDLSKTIPFDNAYAILNGLNFLSISTTNELKGLAKKIVAEKNNPFPKLGYQFLNHIDEVYTIRNYVAHKSKRAKKKLIKMYKDKYQLSDFITPGNFLRQQILDDKLGDSLRSDLYYGAFMAISTSIWEHLDPKSYKYVFEDDTTVEGFRKGVAKMNFIFDRITKENNLDN